MTFIGTQRWAVFPFNYFFNCCSFRPVLFTIKSSISIQSDANFGESEYQLETRWPVELYMELYMELYWSRFESQKMGLLSTTRCWVLALFNHQAIYYSTIGLYYNDTSVGEGLVHFVMALHGEGGLNMSKIVLQNLWSASNAGVALAYRIIYFLCKMQDTCVQDP